MLYEASYGLNLGEIPQGMFSFADYVDAMLLRNSPGFLLYQSPQIIVATSHQLLQILTELVANLHESGCRTGIIAADQSHSTIRVVGDHCLDERELHSRILNINSVRPRTTKRPVPGEEGLPLGGIGIRSIRRHVAQIDGTVSWMKTPERQIGTTIQFPRFSNHILLKSQL